MVVEMTTTPEVVVQAAATESSLLPRTRRRVPTPNRLQARCVAHREASYGKERGGSLTNGSATSPMTHAEAGPDG